MGCDCFHPSKSLSFLFKGKIIKVSYFSLYIFFCCLWWLAEMPKSCMCLPACLLACLLCLVLAFKSFLSKHFSVGVSTLGCLPPGVGVSTRLIKPPAALSSLSSRRWHLDLSSGSRVRNRSRRVVRIGIAYRVLEAKRPIKQENQVL